MEGMLWGVAAMVVKDAVKNPYLKGRDYERNVRQVYRDVDNLRITMDQVKMNCTPEDLSTGEHAPYIKRAERQMKDAYRTLRKHYPRRAGLTRILEHAATPGAEMHLLDIGKEANQTARGLGDLLSEIRFAKIGKSKDEPPPPEPSTTRGSRSPTKIEDSASPRRQIKYHDMAMYEDAVSSGSSSQDDDDDEELFDRGGPLSPSTAYSPSSSTSSSQDRKRRSSSKHHSSSSSSRRSRSQSITARKALPPTSSESSSSSASRSNRLAVILETTSASEREHALDNLQLAIDNVLVAPDAGSEGTAMEFMEEALAEVLRLQKTAGFGGSRLDEDLGDAVEDLDESMKSLLSARTDKESKYAMRRLSHALDDVDHALGERRRHKARAAERRPREFVAEEAPPKALPAAGAQPTRGKLRRQNTSDGSRNRRYSMYK